MVWNRFSILVLVQILLIALVGMLITVSLREEFLKMTSAGLILFWLGQILFLNVYMNRIHRDVGRFMEGLRSQDTTRYFSEGKGGRYFRNLYESFNDIARNFRLVRIEKEAENQFFREALNRSASGLIAVGQDGEIKLVNDAALKILEKDNLSTLSELQVEQPELAESFLSDNLINRQIKIQHEGKQIQVALKSTEMLLEEKPVRIISLLDITREMDWQEVEAWQKLIRVLNHEITNSVVPLHLLSTSLLDLYHEGETKLLPGQVDQEIVDRTVLGLETLIKRSSGLAEFINSYKSFTDVGEADRSNLKLSGILQQVKSLLDNELKKAGVELSLEVDPSDLQILADEKLVEQTLINLVKNSLFALEGVSDGMIRCKAYREGKEVALEVSDNGKGIPAEIREHIFTPFFTTRKDGSGIGLSLARQIMQMHRGSIAVNSLEDQYTTFVLTFQNFRKGFV